MAAEHAELPPNARDLVLKISERSQDIGGAVLKLNQFCDQSFAALALSETSVASVVRAAWGAVFGAAEASPGLEIRRDMAAMMDAAAMGKVFEQLFQNVADHAGGAVTRVLVEIERRRGDVLIKLSDDGVGVPTARAEKIFDPGMRAGKGGAQRFGGGLGLPYCRWMLERHGGGVRLMRSGAGAGGACFELRMPYAGA